MSNATQHQHSVHVQQAISAHQPYSVRIANYKLAIKLNIQNHMNYDGMNRKLFITCSLNHSLRKETLNPSLTRRQQLAQKGVQVHRILAHAGGFQARKSDQAQVEGINLGVKESTWASLRTLVSFQPFWTRPSATGPTKGVITTMATYGMRVSRLLDCTLSPRASSKNDGSHARSV